MIYRPLFSLLSGGPSDSQLLSNGVAGSAARSHAAGQRHAPHANLLRQRREGGVPTDAEPARAREQSAGLQLGRHTGRALQRGTTQKHGHSTVILQYQRTQYGTKQYC